MCLGCMVLVVTEGTFCYDNPETGRLSDSNSYIRICASILGRTSMLQQLNRILEKIMPFLAPIAVLLGLLSRYPVTLPRNVVVHSFLYSLFFFSNALTTLWVSMFGVGTFHIASLISTAVTAGCGFAWYLLLSRKGEELKTNVLHVDKQREERLLSELNYLNQTLIKSGKS